VLVVLTIHPPRWEYDAAQILRLIRDLQSGNRNI